MAYILELFAFSILFLYLSRKFSFSISKLQFLGSNDLDHSVIDVQCTHPLTETFAGI